jgi:hypothetical protein
MRQLVRFDMQTADEPVPVALKYFGDSRRSRNLTFLPLPADFHHISLSRINFLSGELERYR